ncbi:Arc family DNA-binding protein [Alcaligenaceae bacterium]|nr:Arc family DNA-binding protein [Alcaligenaceae bacterium]
MADPKEFPSDKADKFVVRFPDGMRDQIKADADKNDRSMNAEIIERLKSPDPAAAMSVVARLEAELGLCEADKQDLEVRLLALSHFFIVACNKLLENGIHPNDLGVAYDSILSTVTNFAASYQPKPIAESHALILKATEKINELLRASSKKELSLDSLLGMSFTESVERETLLLNDIKRGLDALSRYENNRPSDAPKK